MFISLFSLSLSLSFSPILLSFPLFLLSHILSSLFQFLLVKKNDKPVFVAVVTSLRRCHIASGGTTLFLTKNFINVPDLSKRGVERLDYIFTSFFSCVCVCVCDTVKFTDINSVFGLVILTLVPPVYSWDPPEGKKDASLLTLLLYSYTAAALSCVRGLISVLMQDN